MAADALDEACSGRLRLLRNLPETLAASLAINLLSLAVPVVLMQVYDRIIPNNSGGTLLMLSLGCASAVALEAGLRYARSLIMAWNGMRFEHAVGRAAMERILDSRLEDYLRDSPGSHLERLSSVQTLKGISDDELSQALLDLPFVVVYLAGVWVIGGPLLAAPVAAMLAFLAAIRFLRGRIEKERERRAKADERRFSFLIGLLSRIHSVKALTMEEQLLRSYEPLQAEASVSGFRMKVWSQLIAVAGTLGGEAAFFGTLVAGSALVINGAMTVGGLSACIILVRRSMSPVSQLARFWLRLSEAGSARRRLARIASLRQAFEPGAPALPSELEGGLSMRGVSFRYLEDGPFVFRNAVLEVQAGSMIAIRSGENAGSSTALRLLSGALRPEEGRILVDSFDLSRHDRHDLHGRIECISGTGVLFKGTIIENLSLFDPHKQMIAFDAAALVGLDDLVANLPQGYETQMEGGHGSLLPPGFVQRIAMARALAVRPRVLLCDEAESSMDHKAFAMFKWLLGRLKGSCTIVLATSHPELLSMCDRVYAVRNLGFSPAGADAFAGRKA